MTILRAYSRLPSLAAAAASAKSGKGGLSLIRTLATTAAVDGAQEQSSQKPLFDKILIANRGEIACRIIHTARKLGIKTVAVFSEADRDAMHVRLADEAYLIGPAAAADSYLRADTILDVARRAGAQAIHPGYGFLSENAGFSEQLAAEGMTFIGPPGAAMRAMGSKSESKRIMQAAGVPVVPGYHGDNQDASFLQERAQEIGYSVLIKAVMGGGGKGMRIVNSPDEFAMMLASSRREAAKAFGDDKVLVEKYLATPRHVEVQVFADTLGNAVHLFERDCSVQRRHQKIIEEAPAPDLLPEVRRQLGEKAVAAAKAVQYVGAGTVEFIMDQATQQFYFMEMNTRLQVEHPVTEMVTGTDLVQWQLEVAAGNRLPQLQGDIVCTGHAFEARIYAENPDAGFLPDTGRLVHVATPQPSADVRVETGVQAGDAISVHYDPMIAKLVVRGRDRAAALRVLRAALAEYEVAGVHTNIGFLRRLAQSPDFVAGLVETGYIDKHAAELFPALAAPTPEATAQAALAAAIDGNARLAPSSGDPWAAVDSFRLGAPGGQTVRVAFGDHVYSVDVIAVASPRGSYSVVIRDDGAAGQEVHRFDGARASWEPALSGDGGGRLRVLLGGRLCTSNVVFNRRDASITVFDRGHAAVFRVPQPAYLQGDESSQAQGSVTAPMSCRIVQVMVEPGAEVARDAPLVVLEAMKMEHVIKAPKAGRIAHVYYSVGDLVDEGKSLVAFEEEEEVKKEDVSP